MAWTYLCETNDVPSDEGMRFEPEGAPALALFRVEDEFFVVADMCTHAVASLADGYVDGDIVECPAHHGRFCLRTGEPKSYPVTEPVRTFPVEVRDGKIYVEI